MFWTLNSHWVVKYGYLALKADDHGEGGAFALNSLLCRNINIGILSSKHVEPNSHTDLHEGNEKRSRLGKFFERSIVARRIIIFIVMLGTCMLIGDGILTPAISALVEALSAAVLVVLFLLQKFGTFRLYHHYIIRFLWSKGKEGWLLLGGTILCITGSEAMFADLGHFNRCPIQMAFLFTIYPSLVLTCGGQTAYLIKHTNDR